jgi:hypothetical protein
MDTNSKYSRDFAGKNGFVWFIGTVEDRKDPIKLGRCRVRCIGWHNENKSILPTEALPWAQSVFPNNNTNSYPIKEGDMVFGFFIDGENAQEPLVLGVFPGIPLVAADVNLGFFDPRTASELSSAPIKPEDAETPYPRKLDEPTTSRLARNDSDFVPHQVTSKNAKRLNKVEPASYYEAEYPYNNVYESESGHALEFDDTRGKERVHLYHRSGSYIEMAANGDRTERIERNKFTVVVNDEEVYVQGDVRVYIDGNSTVEIGGNADLTVGGNFKSTIGGTCEITSGGNMTLKAPRIDLNP